MPGTLEKPRPVWTDGVWIGADPPTRYVTFAQWLANPASGYFAWIDISTGVRSKDIAAPHGVAAPGVGTPLLDLTQTIDLAALYGVLAATAGTATLTLFMPGAVALDVSGAAIQPAAGTATVLTQVRVVLASDFGALVAQVGTATLATQAMIALASAYGSLAPAAGTATVAATSADTTAPAVGTLTVPNTTGTAITSINPGTSTDAAGIVGWKMIEQAADSGWSAPLAGDAGWTTIGSTTSWAPGATLSFTSTASATATRYFRLYCKDAAGNVGGSATASATITISASHSVPVVQAWGTLATGNAVTVTPGIPAGTVSGNLLVLLAYGGANPSAPSGWSVGFSGTDVMTRCFYKIATGSDSAPSITGMSGFVAARIARITGHDATTPIDVVSSARQDGSSSPLSVTGVTTTVDHALLMVLGVVEDGGVDDGGGGAYASGVAWGAASGSATTLSTSGSLIVSGFYTYLFGVWTGTATAAGASGSTSLTASPLGDYSVPTLRGRMLAIRPA